MFADVRFCIHLKKYSWKFSSDMIYKYLNKSFRYVRISYFMYCFIAFLALVGLSGCAWGRLGYILEAAWVSSGHLGRVTEQVKRDNDNM